MSMRAFVCHARADIEATSEIVDLLETALELPQAALSSSSLPGYSSDARSELELHQMLAGSEVILALVTDHGATDSTFCFELGAAWAMGIRIVPLLTGNAGLADLPWPLRGIPPVHPHDRAAWAALVADLAQKLGVRVRAASAARIALDEIVVSKSIEPPASPHGSAVFAAVRPEHLAAAPAPAAAVEPMASFSAALGASLPSCEMALEAGHAFSDCNFHRAEPLDFASELEVPFGRFVDRLGGSWADLRKLQDLDVWLSVVDNLLDALPPEQRGLADWYELGSELATLHNIAGEGVSAGPAASSEGEALWREALERFLLRAEALRIRYEDLARVIAQLENLMAAPSERDFTNLARSLEELRRHAGEADRLHSAA